MSWLGRLKNLNVPAPGTDGTDETPRKEVLAVVSVPPSSTSEKIHGRSVVHFQLPDHPANSWATLVGRPGESRAAIIDFLMRRWPGAEVRE